MDKNIKTPKVSVIMPLYNTEKYVREAIQSILDQSFTDFELIIIDDASTDGSRDIVKSFNDPRIIFIENKLKGTIVKSRNQGLEMSRGEYIAPLDSDDIASKNRLAVEVDFLDKNPEFGLVGGNVEVIDSNSNKTGVKWEEKIPSEKIPVRLLFGNCFSQSAVMFRKKAVPENGYNKYSEDYDMWIRITKTWKAVNLSKLLLQYRVHNTSSTARTKPELIQAVNQVKLAQLKDFGVDATNEELDTHINNFGYAAEVDTTKKFIDKREKWLKKLSEINRLNNRYPERIFDEVMAEQFLHSLSSNARLGLYSWSKFWNSPLSKKLNKKEKWLSLLKFFIKCLVGKDTL